MLGVFLVCGRIKIAWLGVSTFVKCVLVSVDGLVGEIEDCRRIDRVAHITGLEVEVAAEAASGVAAKGYRFACLHILVGLDKEFGEVAVNCLQPIGVAHNHVVTVSVTLEVGKPDASVKCGADSVACLELEVNAFMYTFEPGTVSIGRSDVSRGGHSEVAHVNHFSVRNFHSGISVDAF